MNKLLMLLIIFSSILIHLKNTRFYAGRIILLSCIYPPKVGAHCHWWCLVCTQRAPKANTDDWHFRLIEKHERWVLPCSEHWIGSFRSLKHLEERLFILLEWKPHFCKKGSKNFHSNNTGCVYSHGKNWTFFMTIKLPKPWRPQRVFSFSCLSSLTLTLCH